MSPVAFQESYRRTQCLTVGNGIIQLELEPSINFNIFGNLILPSAFIFGYKEYENVADTSIPICKNPYTSKYKQVAMYI